MLALYHIILFVAHIDPVSKASECWHSAILLSFSKSHYPVEWLLSGILP